MAENRVAQKAALEVHDTEENVQAPNALIITPLETEQPKPELVCILFLTPNVGALTGWDRLSKYLMTLRCWSLQARKVGLQGP